MARTDYVPRGQTNRGVRDRLWLAQDGRCNSCGLDLARYPDVDDVHDPTYPTIDHIIPVSRGGSHVWENLQMLCRICNIRKSNHLLLEEQ